MSAEWIQNITIADVLASDRLVDICVPSGTTWDDKEERKRAAFSLFLLEIDPDADFFHIIRGEEISVNYALPAVARLYTDFSEIYDHNI